MFTSMDENLLHTERDGVYLSGLEISVWKVAGPNPLAGKVSMPLLGPYARP